MGIEIYFCQSPIVGDQINEKNEINREAVDLTLNNFGRESTIIRNQTILIFFDWMSFSLIKSFGRLFIKGFPPYQHFLFQHAGLQIGILGMANYDFIIYLHRRVRERDNTIFKVFTIAHELQHVVQYLDCIDAYYQTEVIKGYLMIGEKYTNDKYRKTPSEVDGFRKSKIVAVKVSGKEEVDSFIDQELQESQDENSSRYWINIKELGIDTRYDWKQKTQAFWDEYKGDVVSKASELNKKRKIAELEPAEDNFLQALEIYFQFLDKRK